MLQFRKGPGPRNYLSRREQGWLLVLVMGLGAILWIAVEARNPDHFRWILEWGRGQSAVDQAVDTRTPRDAPRRDDIFTLPSAGETEANSLPETEGPVTEADLATILDDEPFRASEQGVWFKFFRQLKEIDDDALATQSSGPITFIQMYDQPKEYRGEVVTISGTLRRAEEVHAAKNDVGITSYHRTWVFPADNPSNPIVVYMLTLPEGIPRGMTLEEPVELDGFFFKRFPYAAQDAIRSAPVVLARSLRWTPRVPEETGPPMSPALTVAIAAGFAVAVTLLVWWWTKPTRPDEPRAKVPAGLDIGDGPLRVFGSAPRSKP